jgi:methyl-accepting chemotaxis protein
LLQSLAGRILRRFNEVKESVEEAIDLLRRAVAALEKLAAEQERANDLYAEVNEVSLAQAQNVTELSR